MDRTALRIGVVQEGKLVEERLLTDAAITVGRTARSTVILPGEDDLPRWRLFERRRGGYRLRLGPSMTAKISDGQQVVELHDRRAPITLPPHGRGRVVLGDATILFQIVGRPAVPLTRLPHALRRSRARDLDRPFTLLALLSFAAHLAMVLYLRGVDWPRQPDIDELPDRFVHQVIHRPAPPPQPATPTAVPSPVAHRSPQPARPRPSLEQQKRDLVARVQRKGLLQVLSALGPQGAVRDLLHDGAVDRAQEQALRDVGGLAVAQEGALLPLGATPKGGRIVDVTGLRDHGRIAVADVGPGAGERRAPTIRTEAPALDEPVPGFDPRLLGRTIRDRMADVRACYERALKQRASIAGKLVLRFVLTPAGTVASVDVEEDTLGDPEVTACVKNAIARWRFPAPPRQVEVSFPFVFQPAS